MTKPIPKDARAEFERKAHMDWLADTLRNLLPDRGYVLMLCEKDGSGGLHWVTNIEGHVLAKKLRMFLSRIENEPPPLPIKPEFNPAPNRKRNHDTAARSPNRAARR
jgi:hypothetical protein